MQREYKTMFFRDKEFQVVKGLTHPDYSYHTFEREEHEFRNKYWNIQSDDIVYDIGASYGSYTLTACVMGATVYAFEPEKTVFPDLVHNIGINNWHSKCFPMNIGMWSSEVLLDMKTYAPHWPAYTISDDYQMKTIDDISNLTQIIKLDWMKIDIEGAEEEAIKGGLKTIGKFRPKLIIECHIFLDQELANKVKKLISPYNYYFDEIIREPAITICAYPKDTK